MDIHIHCFKIVAPDRKGMGRATVIVPKNKALEGLSQYPGRGVKDRTYRDNTAENSRTDDHEP